MKNVISQRFQTLTVGLVIGLISLLIPLLRDFHWESAGLAALVAALYSALLSSSGKEETVSVFTKSTGLIIGWSVPLIIFSFFTDCMSFAGTAYWLFGPMPSMLLGWSIGRLINHFRVVYRKTAVFSVVVVIGVIPTLVEFLTFPQLYFFNHIWSYWPGPIYDEIVPFDSRLLFFRGITFFWVITLWATPHFFDHFLYRWIVILAMISISFSYYQASTWGLIAPEERLQSELGAVHETKHFMIFYTLGSVNASQLEDWEKRHEDALKSITNVLEIDPGIYQSEKIHSYIYNSQGQKKKLTGAGQTSYVPVWIGQDQTHIAHEHLERVLKHELVHVVAKQFGNWFGASTSIGLVEGLAVALDPERYRSSVHHLVAAREEWPGAVEIKNLFRPAGFYFSAGPISYVVSGSFVHYLIENYPVEKFRTAYKTGNLEMAYVPATLEELTGNWHRFLESVKTDEEDERRSAALFRTRSVFEKPCPRVVRQRDFRDQLTGHGDAFFDPNTSRFCS